jgi:hypothetical protein
LDLTENCSEMAGPTSPSAFTMAKRSARPLSPGLARIRGFALKISEGEVENRTKVFDNEDARGGKFLDKVRRAARRHRLACRWSPERGAGAMAPFISAGDSLSRLRIKNDQAILGTWQLSDTNRVAPEHVGRTSVG